MKKTLIIALAGIMMFAFTQCGGGSVTDTKQFTDVKEAYDEIEKMIKDAKTCEELEEAAFTLALGSLFIGADEDEYTEEELLTENEKKKVEEIIEQLSEEAQKKANKMGCDFED